jgi:hypothetical protein
MTKEPTITRLPEAPRDESLGASPHGDKSVCSECGRVFRSTFNEVVCPGCQAVSPPLRPLGISPSRKGREEWREPDELN